MRRKAWKPTSRARACALTGDMAEKAKAGVSLPISAPTADVIVGVLGIVVVIARMFAKKPGVLASPSSKS